VLDYEISKAATWPANWYDEKRDDKNATYQSEVTVHRKGDFIFPAEVEVKFEDGSKVREHWDGKDRWTRFRYDTKAKLLSAEVDPDHKVWLDVDFYNNSRLAQMESGNAHRKIANYWVTFTQCLEQMLGWVA
jgi:hypothetical protein